MHFILWIVSFIFFKGMSPLLLDEPIGVMAAALLAATVSITYFFMTFVAAGPSIKMIDDLEAGRRTEEIPWYLFGLFAVALTAAVLLSYFVLIGFSPNLAREVDLVRGFGRFGRYEQTWFWFIVMIAIPLVVASGPLFREVFRGAREAKKAHRSQNL